MCCVAHGIDNLTLDSVELLTRWSRETHICVSILNIIGSYNDLSPGQCQNIIWTHFGILLIEPLLTNSTDFFLYLNSNISIEENAFETVVCEMAAILFQPQCDHRLLYSISTTSFKMFLMLLDAVKSSFSFLLKSIWWRHEMETFSALRALVRGLHRSPVKYPHKGQWRGGSMLFWSAHWVNGWINNREVGDLRRHCVHYEDESSASKD